MSLADQQWCPTSVQVTVLQARGLRIKGKNGTNDAYAVMQVGKEKYQTSVVEKTVAPVWKEEASFDLPPLHQSGGGGGERGTLHVCVSHRALVGPDKQLGQAVINLLQLSEDKSRNKTEWFKLLDKTGKADKDRGEVLLDIQFMRNNMTASMFDLSAAGKSRSRLGKFKDKVRGKKKESDTVSSVVPSVTQVLTDSEEEAANGDGELTTGKDEKKKKHKIKSLFSPKSNLQKNMSQSMSVLPVKNSSLSGSQSSGLNVDSSEGKKKFKFKIHKRSGSDSKDSSSGHQKHGSAEQSNLCINGSHVYCEEPPPRTSRIGSNFSLASSGHGSMEDVPESSPPSVDSLRAVRQYSPWTEEEEDEEETAETANKAEDVNERRREEEEERRRKIEEEEEEERVKRQEALERLAEERRRQEEEERRRIEEEEERVRREEEERIQREEERRRQEEEESVRREEEERERLAEEKRLEEQERKRVEEEEKRQREEEERIRAEEERAQEQRRRQEEEERIRREEEQERQRLAEEKMRTEEQERRRMDEEERRQREEEERIRVEEERIQEERRRQEEEERIRREEEQKLAEEKRRLEEERKIEEEQARKEEEERIRREKERAEEERRRKEEEERARKEKEEYDRLVEEKRKLEEEERERIEAEEKIRREEEERIRIAEERRRKEEEAERARREEEEREEKRRLEEQERMRIEEEEKRQREEEERIRKDKERRQEEEERARKEKEECERLEEQKRRLEEQERKQKEEEERIRMEEERAKQEEEERAKKEKEEMERLAGEKRIREEQEKRRIEEEEKIKREEEKRMEEAERERKEEEARKLENEKLTADKEERKKRENKAKDGHKAAGQKSKVAVESLAEVTSTNPFDENFSYNPFEEIPNSAAEFKSSTTKVSDVQQGSVGGKTISTDEKDLISAQREKRPAPQPPGRSQAESWGEQDVSTRHLAQINKQGNDKDVKTDSVLPQCSVKMIAPLSQPLTDTKNTQSLEQTSTTKGAASARLHSKRPAPSRPRSVEESSEPKTALSSNDNISQRGVSETKQVPVVYGLNPFEDDEDELTAQDDTTAPIDAIQWPPAVSQDAASQAKLKSSKMAHAPAPPAKKAPTSSTLIHQNTDGDHVTDETAQKTSLKEPKLVRAQSTGEEAGVKKEVPPVPSRRLQPVKPLNPQEQQSVSIVQGGKDNKSTGIPGEVQEKTKVNDTGLKGPYSQLTREELISLVLKQENQLSERDRKISELEQYIDNLLVRVMEEQPSILMSMSSLKKAV